MYQCFLVLQIFWNDEKICKKSTTIQVNSPHSIYFQNEEIFIQLDELYKLDRITHAINSIQLQPQKTF